MSITNDRYWIIFSARIDIKKSFNRTGDGLIGYGMGLRLVVYRVLLLFSMQSHALLVLSELMSTVMF